MQMSLGMKGNLSMYMYLMLFVMIGIILLIFTMSSLKAINSDSGRAQELAINIAVSIDALSSQDEGLVKLDTGGYKYDVEIQKKEGVLRMLGSAVSSSVLDEGYYVVVAAQSANNKGAVQKFFRIRSYDTSKNYGAVSMKGVDKVCIEKKHLVETAAVVKCE